MHSIVTKWSKAKTYCIASSAHNTSRTSMESKSKENQRVARETRNRKERFLQGR
jgi:hypothetical protein